MNRVYIIIVLALVALIEFVLLLDQWRDGDVDNAVHEVQAGVCLSANAGADLALLDLQDGLSKCQAQWAQSTARADAATSLALTAKAQAARDLEAWRVQYTASPPSCTAARLALDTACADLDGY